MVIIVIIKAFYGGQCMERYAWVARIIEGKEKEYIYRHDNIWPELKQLLKDAGIENYSIWQNGNQLFGYYECRKGLKYAADIQKNSPIVDKWNAFMKDVMIMEMDPTTGAQPLLKEVFYLK